MRATCYARLAEPTGRGPVYDGDTIQVVFLSICAGRMSSRIRIGGGIDACELDQPWGPEARGALHALLAGHLFAVHLVETDRWGRLVARLDAGHGDVGEWLVRLGLAWHWSLYSREWAERYAAAQAEAAASRRGLWSAKDPVPPWEHRRRRAR